MCQKTMNHHCSGCCHAEPLHRSCISTEVWSQEVSNNNSCSCIWPPCRKKSCCKVRNNSSQIKISFDHLEFDSVFWRSPREKFQVSGTVDSLTVCTIIFNGNFMIPTAICQLSANRNFEAPNRSTDSTTSMANAGASLRFEGLSFWETNLFDVNFLRFNIVRLDNARIRVI